MSTALAIFVKTPGFSPVKTRLALALDQAVAERFHMLAAAAVAAVARNCEGITPFWAVAENESAAKAQWPGFATIRQGEGGLGSRLDRVYRQLLASHDRVLMVGADAPQITPKLLQAAVAAMHDLHKPFVIGNATDGGFWLFGGCMPIAARRWQAVTYSQSDTTAQLRSQLQYLGGITEMPTLSDVDTVDDIPMLQRELAALDPALPEQRELAKWLTQWPAVPDRSAATHILELSPASKENLA